MKRLRNRAPGAKACSGEARLTCGPARSAPTIAAYRIRARLWLDIPSSGRRWGKRHDPASHGLFENHFCLTHKRALASIVAGGPFILRLYCKVQGVLRRRGKIINFLIDYLSSRPYQRVTSPPMASLHKYSITTQATEGLRRRNISLVIGECGFAFGGQATNPPANLTNQDITKEASRQFKI